MAAQGDPEAFDALVAPRRTRFLLLLAATALDWHEAEDALQEALWRAFREVRRLRESESFDAWLRSIVLNAARDHLRAAIARARREGRPGGDLADLEGLLGVPGAAPEEGIADREGCMRVCEAIAVLPPQQRHVGSLAWVAGMAPRDIAAALGVSADSVHALLYRARRRVGASLREGGRGVVGVHIGTLRIAGWSHRVDPLVAHWQAARPDLRARRVDAGSADADVQVETFWGEPPLEAVGELSPDAGAIPLDGLAEAVGFDLEPFGDRLVRFSKGGRVTRLPWHATAMCVVYNADLLTRAGLGLPPADWLWDDFVACCRRCGAAGIAALPMLGFLGGDLVPYVAEQLGATTSTWGPVREALALVADLRAGVAGCAPDDIDDIWERTFYPGGAAFVLSHSGNPYWGFAEPENSGRPFRWGIAPMPRVRRSDGHVTMWYRTAAAVRGAAPDAVAAFSGVRAMFTDGPAPRGGELPAYRTAGVMRAWRADGEGAGAARGGGVGGGTGGGGRGGPIPEPLGRGCLLELDAATGPLEAPGWLYGVPGGREACRRALDGEITAEACIAALRGAAGAG